MTTNTIKNMSVIAESSHYVPAIRPIRPFHLIPDMFRRIVTYCVSNSAPQILKKEVLMSTETTPTIVAETPAVVVADNIPQIVAVRNGKKGPGKEIVVVKTKSDAEKVKADLLPTLPAGSEVIFRDVTETVILSYEDWSNAAKAALEATAKRQAALATLTDEQKAALGL